MGKNGVRFLNNDGGKWCERLLNSCVSVVGKVKKLLNNGVSAMKKEQRVVEKWCFSNGKDCLFLN
jgi:hypothetical protein